MAPEMRCLDPDSPKFKELSAYFYSSWKDSKKTAQVQSIYTASREAWINSDQNTRFRKYVNQKGGKTRITFHGTQRACHVGHSGFEGSSLRLCEYEDCSLCSILEDTFRAEYASSGGMFGPGIYSSPYASKADRYAKNHYIKSNLHAMIICKVVHNNPQRMYEAENLAKPDRGFDCVEGITRKHGGSLKNPEIVVYRDDAIIPAGVIMYTRQGWDPAR